MLHLYTGNGKGKTTASVGMAVRAWGHGKHIIFCQFMKNGNSGELQALRQLSILLLQTPPVTKLTFQMTPQELSKVCQEHSESIRFMKQTIASENPDMVIFDELATALACGIISEEDARELISQCGPAEVIITGRGAPTWLMETADYISDIQCIRHPYEKGVQARIGIEW